MAGPLDNVTILENIVSHISASSKYADIATQVIRREASDALRAVGAKEAEKFTRKKLHGMTEMFLTKDARRLASSYLEMLPGDGQALESVLSLHSSTAERLPLQDMDAFYERVFSVTGRPRRILDIGCGMNPVYLVCRGFAVTGIDANAALMRQLSAWNDLADTRPGDILDPASLPREKYDLALVMKVLPILETYRRGEGKKLLENINASFVLVTFPTRSLGGRNKGMGEHYRDMMSSLVPAKYRIADSFEHGTELAYILREVE